MSRELDALIDQHLFGMPVRWGPEPYAILPLPAEPRPEQPYRYGVGPDGCHYNWAPVPRYSRDIAAAWVVVERITRPPTTLEAAGRAANTRFGFWWDRAHLWAMGAEEAAHAICRAAAEAMGIPVERRVP